MDSTFPSSLFYSQHWVVHTHGGQGIYWSLTWTSLHLGMQGSPCIVSSSQNTLEDCLFSRLLLWCSHVRAFYSTRLAGIAFSSTSGLCLLVVDPEGSLLVKMDLGGWVDFAKPMLAGTSPLQYIPYCTGCPVSGKPHQKSGPLAAALLSLLFFSWNPCLESSLGVFTSAGERGRVCRRSLSGVQSLLWTLTSSHPSPLLQHHQVKNTKLYVYCGSFCAVISLQVFFWKWSSQPSKLSNCDFTPQWQWC